MLLCFHWMKFLLFAGVVHTFMFTGGYSAFDHEKSSNRQKKIYADFIWIFSYTSSHCVHYLQVETWCKPWIPNLGSRQKKQTLNTLWSTSDSFQLLIILFWMQLVYPSSRVNVVHLNLKVACMVNSWKILVISRSLVSSWIRPDNWGE